MRGHKGPHVWVGVCWNGREATRPLISKARRGQEKPGTSVRGREEGRDGPPLGFAFEGRDKLTSTGKM